MKKHEIIALGFFVFGGTLEVIAIYSGKSEVLRGVGVLAIFLAVAFEIIGIAIYENNDDSRKK
jgi:hypothetical protein